jgi:type IV secretory pathway VirB2 component (pilin)
MGMGGAQGPRGDRRRRLVAWVVVIVLVLGAAATFLTLVQL